MKGDFMKKIISIVLSFVLVLGTFSLSFAADVSKLEENTKLFVQGEGPEVNSLKVDYLSFSPTVLRPPACLRIPTRSKTPSACEKAGTRHMAAQPTPVR